MKVGFARLNMTPPFGYNLVGYFHPRPADDILTHLYVNAVVIDNDETKAALVTIDAEGATADCTEIIRNYTAEKTGLDPDAIFISCTHIHQGIGMYGMGGFHDIVKTRIADAVQLAIYDLKEAKAFVARGTAEGISFIRLARANDDPNVFEPLGTPDNEVQLLKFTREGASDIAVVQFQTHPDVIGGTKICHDWPGFVRMYLEQALCDEADGKGVNAICFNGAQGDTAHVDKTSSVKRGGIRHSKHMARVITGAVLGMYTYAKEVSTEGILFKRTPVFINSQPKPTAEQVEIARKVIAAYNEGCAKAKAEGRSQWDGGAEAVKDFPFGIVPARKYIGLIEEPDVYEFYLSSIAFGDVAFIGFPGEPFTEIGRQTKALSPFEMTFPCCMTNGQEGYFPTLDAFDHARGYETSATHYERGTAEKFIDAAVSLAKELKEKIDSNK